MGAVHEGVRPARCCDLSGVLEAQGNPRSHPDGRCTSWERYVIRIVGEQSFDSERGSDRQDLSAFLG
jgi:hypothetical protein